MRKKITWLFVALIPYFVLVLLLIINPFLHQAAYCPLPTALEQKLGGIFPSVITGWWYYAIAIPFVELLLVALWLPLSAVAIGVASIFKPKFREKARVRLFRSLPFLVMVFGFVFVFVLRFLLAQADLWRAETIVMIAGSIVTMLAVLGSVIWLFVAGALQKRKEDPVVKRRGKRTIWMGVFWLIMSIILPAVFFTALIIPRTLSIGVGGAGMMAADVGGSAGAVGSPMMFADAGPVSRNTIGFAVGGAKDADNFRENIKNCYLPIPSDITYEGLYFDYMFETANQTQCSALFCPQYESAVLADPFSKDDEYFLSVGLGSGLGLSEFKRPALDVVIVLDVSGSMSSSFNRYYYDQFRVPGAGPVTNNDWNTSKMEIAKEAIRDMVDHLNPDDRFGMVLFDDTASEFIPFQQVNNNTVAASIKEQVSTLEPRGGTNMEAGLMVGTQVMESLPQITGEDRERRIIFLTDAMPNTGALEENELYRIGSKNADSGIHTTFIGIGVDFNTELVELLTKEIRGANYFAIHSSSDFEKRLDTEFEYLIAPLVYDLKLDVSEGDYEIRAVYGSPEANKATGEVLHVSSLFPSPTADGQSRGGVILVHMDKVDNTNTPTKLVVSYEDRQGITHTEEQMVEWTSTSKTSPSQNVRKAALLARYANLMQNWIIDENLRQGPHEKTIYIPIQPISFYDEGLIVPIERYPAGEGTQYMPVELSRWERLSRPLQVSQDYKDIFADFAEYFESESQRLSEQDLLEDELKILKNLTKTPNP